VLLDAAACMRPMVTFVPSPHSLCLFKEFRALALSIGSLATLAGAAQADTLRLRITAGVLPLPYASARALPDGAAATGDERGVVLLPVSAWPVRVRIAAAGHVSDTLYLPQRVAALDVALEPVRELKAAEVVERAQATHLSLRGTQATEAIGAKELKRAACCDLSESFETNATVDVSYSDAVSGTKTLRMLGLDGKYAQLSVENIPFVRGLSANYGLTLIPGPWINAINVSKGVGTAVNGPNAMTGQIDLCLLNPFDAPPLFTNLYVNSQGRRELNVNAGQLMGRHAANVLMVQGSSNQLDMDQNGDGFRDMPLGTRFNVMDRWIQRKGRRTTQVMARYVTDVRNGGNTDAHRSSELPGGGHYRVDIANEMGDVLVKNGWILRDSTKSIGLLGSFRNHTLSSRFGDRRHEGVQLSGYLNAVYQQLVNAAGDQLKAGASWQYDAFDERFLDPASAAGDSAFSRIERMPGVFAEFTRTRKRLTLVAGARADMNALYGTTVSPRLHLKFDPGPLTTLRLGAGRAFRSALPFVENAGALASSRRVNVAAPLGLERSWNFGASLLHKWKWFRRKWSLGLDVYHSTFTDQVVADLDRSPRTLALYMLDGRSFANSVLADLQVALDRRWDLKLSYRWYDVRTTYDGVLRERPFTPRHRGLVDLAYASINDHWRFDITLNLFGTARLPDTEDNPEAYRLPARAPAYATLNAQLTRVFGALEVYVGGENLTSVQQARQVLAPEAPFGPYFDASLIWGPTNKAMIYGGFRHTFNRKDRGTGQP